MIACQPPVPGEKEMAIFNTTESLRPFTHGHPLLWQCIDRDKAGMFSRRWMIIPFFSSSAYSQETSKQKDFPLVRDIPGLEILRKAGSY